MSLIFIAKDSTNTTTRSKVGIIHNEPSQLSPADRANGIEVSFVPTPAVYPGKYAVLFINTQTKDLWYEYFDRPLTLDERCARLEEENANINYTLMMLEVV